MLSVGALAVPANAVECGTPAQDAVYKTVEIPAVTHVEYEWQLTATVTEYQWSRVRVVQEYVPAVEEQGHYETVVVTPAVTETQHEYVHRDPNHPNSPRWEEAGWNDDPTPNSNGWTWTGNTREIEVTPAVTEDRWVVDVEAQPAVDEVTVTDYGWGVEAPEGTDWSQTGQTRQVAGATSFAWGVEAPTEGWEPTGKERTVVDQEPRTERELVSPAVPAGPPCVDDDPDTDEPREDRPDGDDKPRGDRPDRDDVAGGGKDRAEEPTSPAAGGKLPVAAVLDAPAVKPEKKAPKKAAKADTTEALPQTGAADGLGAQALAGVGLLLAGLAALRRRRPGAHA